MSRFVVLLPVKPPALGKSRLTVLGDSLRREFAEAFALDTAEAALHTEGVVALLAITDDQALATTLLGVGCEVIDDHLGGLNDALRQGAREAAQRWPAARPVALLADLPALSADELGQALKGLAGLGARAGFVRDHSGSGTTLYSATHQDFTPAFGPDSAEAHLALGAIELQGDWPTLRQDVDVAADLARILQRGAGRHTARVIARMAFGAI